MEHREAASKVERERAHHTSRMDASLASPSLVADEAGKRMVCRGLEGGRREDVECQGCSANSFRLMCKLTVTAGSLRSSTSRQLEKRAPDRPQGSFTRRKRAVIDSLKLVGVAMFWRFWYVVLRLSCGSSRSFPLSSALFPRRPNQSGILCQRATSGSQPVLKKRCPCLQPLADMRRFEVWQLSA
jgi:hypothetical protein